MACLCHYVFDVFCFWKKTGGHHGASQHTMFSRFFAEHHCRNTRTMSSNGSMKANPSVAPAPMAPCHIAWAALDYRITALLSRSWLIKINQCCCSQVWFEREESMESSYCSLIELQSTEICSTQSNIMTERACESARADTLPASACCASKRHRA